MNKISLINIEWNAFFYDTNCWLYIPWQKSPFFTLWKGIIQKNSFVFPVEKKTFSCYLELCIRSFFFFAFPLAPPKPTPPTEEKPLVSIETFLTTFRQCQQQNISKTYPNYRRLHWIISSVKLVPVLAKVNRSERAKSNL